MIPLRWLPLAACQRTAIPAALMAGFLLTPLAHAAPQQVTLPADPPDRATLALVEQWRVGGEDDEDVLLGVVDEAVRDEAGQVYLLDTQLSQVVVVAPDGSLVGTLSREGEGPGEVNQPQGLFLLDGGRVGIVQGFPGKVVLVDATDTPAGTIEFNQAESGGFFMLQGAAWRDGHLLVGGGRTVFDPAEGKSRMETVLALRDLEGNELVRFAAKTREHDFSNLVFDEASEFDPCSPARWALSDAGAVYLAPERDRYLIQRFDAQGELQLACERSFTPRRRSDTDKSELTSGMRVIINGQRQEIENHVLDHDPAIRGLHVAADGNLWVTTCFDRAGELPEGVLARYDVISPRGEFLREVLLQAPQGDRHRDGVVFLDGRHFLLIRNQEAATRAMNAGFDEGDDDADADSAADQAGLAEPLEVILYAVDGA